jgi:flagellar hook-associated protein 3 FlgL
MSSISAISPRVSDLLSQNLADSQINATEAQLLTLQTQLTTGKMVNQPSDNPGAAAAILNLQKSLVQRTAYASNISTAQSQLGIVGNSLTSLNNLLLQAQNIASTDVQSTVTQSQRSADGQVVNSLITEAQSLANTQINGVYVFGGAKSNQEPFVSAGGGVQFVGSPDVLQTQVDQNTLMPTEVSGQTVFGGLSPGVAGTGTLSPAVSSTTQISSLTGATGDGVTLGAIQLSNGTTTQTVDLSSAQTMGDVVADINSANVGSITATLTSTGIQLTGGPSDNITITDPAGETSAADLGINTGPNGAGTGTVLNGTPVQPQVTLFTPLADLNGGAGIDSSGIIISNGAASKTLTFSPGGDVQSVLNAINGSGLGVVASINSAGTGINVQNATQGTTLTIGENGGTTATDLGIRSFSPATQLSALNNGQGVGTAAAGTTGDFSITNSNGSSFTVSVAGATTVQNVLDAINTAATAAGSNVTASFATTGNGIILTDTSGGSGTLAVQDINNSTAAADLGLTAPASSTSTTITGADVNGVQTPGVFTNLQNLAKALQTGNVSAITAAATNLQADYTRITNANGIAGAQSQELQNRSSDIDTENLATQTFLSNIQDTNMTSAISEFQTLQTALQASLQTTVASQSLTLFNFIAT